MKIVNNKNLKIGHEIRKSPGIEKLIEYDVSISTDEVASYSLKYYVRKVIQKKKKKERKKSQM